MWGGSTLCVREKKKMLKLGGIFLQPTNMELQEKKKDSVLTET